MYVNSLTKPMNRNMLFPGDEKPRRFPDLRLNRNVLFPGDEKPRRYPYLRIVIIAAIAFALSFGFGFMRVSSAYSICRRAQHEHHVARGFNLTTCAIGNTLHAGR
jgi:hypothetical protein